MKGKRLRGLSLAVLTGCAVQPVTEMAVETAPSPLRAGCQFTLQRESDISGTAGRYRQVQFAYLPEGTDQPKRFTAEVLTFPPGAVRAELLDQPNLEQYESVPQAAKGRGAIAALNGGYYGEEFEPIGLYILNGQSQQSMSNASGLLSGVVSIDAAGAIELETRAGFSAFNVVSAFQSGPFLVDPGGVLGIYSDNNKLRKRTAVAQSDQGETVTLITSPTSLYTLAQCLQTQPEALGVNRVERALNLDGGISTGVYAALPEGDLEKPEEVAVRSMLLLYSVK